MRVRWLRVAVSEARDARVYYDERQAGLGARFTRELAATVKRIRDLPETWPEVETSLRRALVNRFPYLVHYTVEHGVIIIIGVYHSRRRPISRRTRLE